LGFLAGEMDKSVAVSRVSRYSLEILFRRSI
jgi:hypothetical protein